MSTFGLLGMNFKITLVDGSDIFYFFSARHGGSGSPRRWEGRGDRFVIENARRGVGWAFQDGRGREAGRVSATNWRGGAKYFFSGPKCPPSYAPQKLCSIKIPELNLSMTLGNPVDC